ncbi:MAG: TIGR04282 family arsenosugar biosynthesis glycosyltransferase [Pseudomonadota bacterium]|nr:TIGR04282 family arsenosugar biosynthesis glycosyltransferase [Pseudomonadota bacterium]
MNSPCRVIVMAKAPVAGHAKTRLIPALGAAGAAALAERLLDHAVRQAVAADIGPVDLCGAPECNHATADPGAHPAFVRLREQLPIELTAQGTGDLGERMHRAFERVLGSTHGNPRHALLIGTDAPALDAALLNETADALNRTDAVFVPAHDGGYVLVGLRRPAIQLFEQMRWSTPTVMACTRERLAAAGLRHVELPPLHDIDEPADLLHLPPGWLE